MDKNKAMKLALDALLIWEEMCPKTTASAIRSPAIQALQEALEQPEGEWVGLTGEEIDEVATHLDNTTIGWSTHEFARAIEAKLKDKNRD